MRHAVAAACLLAGAAPVAAQTADPLAPVGAAADRPVTRAATPPMGWSSWNAFRTEITEEKLLGSAQVLLDSGLAALGYTQVNIDDGWWLKRRTSDGRLQVRTAIFPSAEIGGGRDTSLRPLTDRLHAMGLRAGIYTDVGRNACSQAYDLHSPNLPEGTQAEREVGLAGHVDADMRLFFAEWNFDYVKVDACGLADYAPGRPHVVDQGYRPTPPLIVRGEPARTDTAAVRRLYEEVAAALHRHDPDGDAVLSICAWGQADVRQWGKDVGNLWRTGEDITPSWTSMLQSFDTAVGRSLYAHPGAWNDPDMLFIGSGDFDADHLVEARSHLSLWAIINAPLTIGFDLRNAPRPLLDILGNRAVIAINQDPAGHQGSIVYQSDDLQIVAKELSDGSKAVALLNRTGAPLEATLLSRHLNFLDNAPVTLSDLWNGAGSTSFSGEHRLTLAPRETRLFRATGRHELGAGRYLSELPGRLNVAVDGVRQSELDPTIHRGLSPWSGSRSTGERPMYSGWGGAQADRAPYGTTLTVAGQPYGSGIGILSGSRIEVRAQGRYARFRAVVGVDDSSRDRETRVRFSVYGDGKLLHMTDPLSFGAAAVPLDIPVSSVRVLELVVRNEGDPRRSVTVAWAEASLT